MSIPFTWIYLIHDPYTGLYKIGKSDNPDRRLEQLRNASSYGTIAAAPTDYDLLEAWLCSENTETLLHKQLSKCRIRGEWFDLCAFFGLNEKAAFICDDVRFSFETRFMIDSISFSSGETPRVIAYEALECIHLSAKAEIAALRSQLAAAKLAGYQPKLLPAHV